MDLGFLEAEPHLEGLGKKRSNIGSATCFLILCPKNHHLIGIIKSLPTSL